MIVVHSIMMNGGCGWQLSAPYNNRLELKAHFINVGTQGSLFKVGTPDALKF